MICNLVDKLSQADKKKYIILNERLSALYELRNIDISLFVDSIEEDEFNKNVAISERETIQQLKEIINI
ncbi:hypothetical protein [uncultured Clostridium sp.]|uniref:hypothetical protein n=1 Tax=uncultured Clostridium sp. TaxID=59620 RepID=UPI003216E0D7